MLKSVIILFVLAGCLDSCYSACDNGTLENTSNGPLQLCDPTPTSMTHTQMGPTTDIRVWLGVTGCFVTVLLICAVLLIIVLSLVYYIRTRSTTLKTLERRIIFTNNNIQTPSVDLEVRANSCNNNEHDDVMYATINLSDMLENCTDPVQQQSGNRYSTADEVRRSATAAQYMSPRLNMSADLSKNLSNAFDVSVFSCESSDSPLRNVDNLLYSPVHLDEDSLKRSKSTLYSTYEAVGRRNNLFSSSVVRSHRQRIEDVQPMKLETGKKYFSKQEKYVEPPSDLSAIFDTMCSRNFREINRDYLLLRQKIGSGCFGEVKLAEWRVDQDSDPLPVAVKLLSEKADEKLRVSFLKEAAVMGQFQHPNVLQLLGIVSATQSIMLVIELMESDLRTILESLGNVKFDSDRLATSLLRSTKEIVCGMDYLSSKHFVHRDLAARNVLVGQDKMCRISDFGMSKRMHDDKDYYKVEKGDAIPVRWTAPEALFYRRYSEKSDVWSLGMTLFEVWSVGRKPWDGYTNLEVVGMLSTNQKQGAPTGCPYEIYALMISTWRSTPEHRPTFKEISESLNKSDQLLRIPEEVKSNPKACKLGNDPSLTAELYSDLRS